MERFNGVALEDVAPVTISGVYVEPPKIKPKWEDRPVNSGAHFIRTRYEERTIEISFYLPVVDAEERAEYIAAINAWAHSSEPKQLETSKRPGKYIMAVLSKLPSPSAGKWWEKLSIEFEAGDPFFYDSGLTAAPIGTSFEIDNVYGAVDAHIKWTNPSEASSPAWVLDETTTITISGSVAAGAVVLYVDPIAATLDGDSVMDQVTLASRPFELTCGAHVITGNGTLFYRERCL